MHQYVLRLEIAVNDAMPVRVVERAGDAARDAKCLVNEKLPIALQLRTQRFAVHERHYWYCTFHVGGVCGEWNDALAGLMDYQSRDQLSGFMAGMVALMDGLAINRLRRKYGSIARRSSTRIHSSRFRLGSYS